MSVQELRPKILPVPAETPSREDQSFDPRLGEVH